MQISNTGVFAGCHLSLVFFVRLQVSFFISSFSDTHGPERLVLPCSCALYFPVLCFFIFTQFPLGSVVLYTKKMYQISLLNFHTN